MAFDRVDTTPFGVVLCVYRVDCILLGDILFESKVALHISGGKLFLSPWQAEMEGPNILRLRTVCCVSDGQCRRT